MAFFRFGGEERPLMNGGRANRRQDAHMKIISSGPHQHAQFLRAPFIYLLGEKGQHMWRSTSRGHPPIVEYSSRGMRTTMNSSKA